MNKVVLMGRLTADPELKTTPAGLSVVSFTVASDRNYSKGTAEKQVDFIDVVAWRQTAEFICKYFKKGQMILVCGSMQTRMYVDKNGSNRKLTEVLAESVHFTGDKAKSTDYGSNNNLPETYNTEYLDEISNEDLPF